MSIVKTVILSGLLVTSLATAQTAGEQVETNSIGMKFLYIPAGSFLMGAGDDVADAFANEKPQHKVNLSKPFLISQYEVTQAEWEAVMGVNPYTLERSNPFYNLPGMKARITRPNHPATVSWLDAQDFIAKLNAKENTTTYRLPSEAEWEYAARAGTTTAYSFGDDADELANYAWYGEGFTNGGTHPVGTKQPNPWGLYDVHGNAWEWVADTYTPYSADEVTDPLNNSGQQHVVRGGSWHSTADSWRSTTRKGYDSDYRGISIGFRLVKEIE